MTQTEYLIVGGGVAGTTAAELIRQREPNAAIYIVTAEPYRFYSRIMLSKPTFFLEKVPFDTVFLKSETWPQENRIDFTLGHQVVALDPVGKIVTLDNGEKIAYQKLLLALGTGVNKCTFPGADKAGILYLRTLDDAKQVIAAVKTSRHAVVIGGGFISFEMCDMLKMAGLEVTLVLREKYFWEPTLDEASGRMVEAALTKGGVKIIYESVVTEAQGDSKVTAVKLSNGQTLPAEMIIAGIGTHADLDWLIKAGLKCNRGILANEYLETSLPDVWTAGDIAEYKDLILNENIQLGSWPHAMTQGRTAAFNMMGQHQPYQQVTFYNASGFGTTIAFVGDVRVLPGRTVIERGSPAANGYTRIILMDGEVEGATMINRTPDLMPLSKIIAANIKIEPYLKQLSDPNYNLNDILKS